MRVGVITSDCGNNTSWLLPFSDSDFIMALRQNGPFIDVIDKNGDSCCGCWSVSASDQSHWVLSAQHQYVLILPLKVQHLHTNEHTVSTVCFFFLMHGG